MKSFVLPVVLAIILLLVISLYFPEETQSFISDEVASFTSKQEFKAYLQEAQTAQAQYYYGISPALDTFRSAMPEASLGEVISAPTGGQAGGEVEPSRVSETNVQVAGIDEPDIVKTDGSNIYFSTQGYKRYWFSGGAEIAVSRSIDYYPYTQGETKVIDSFPPQNLSILNQINKTGDLLLTNNTLIIFSYDEVYGYDISNPQDPQRTWTISLNSSIVSARLYEGQIYLITQQRINYYDPCPIMPLLVNGIGYSISCNSIYYPRNPMEVDVTYNAMIINPETGSVESAVSFIGTQGSSTVYMSENAVYITYALREDIFNITNNFINQRADDLLPASIIERLNTIADYDLSSQSKMTEYGIIIQNYRASLSDDERLRFDNELNNRMSAYQEEHKRDFVRTGIIKISLDMQVQNTGSFPGVLLNQFSLDEYNNNLRIATTVGSWDSWANDVYVMNNELNIIGSVIDLGLGERIYSARFIADKGYLVTYKQIDPFFVLDLSNPASPEVKGELKIPGYSSYLHPITDDKILGVGKEDSNVKISLFDVSNPENPVETSKYTLTEYWTDILSTHHAFLLDREHDVFFLPGSNGGYVFSYEGDSIALVKAVSDIRARRAVYINDYLYIIGEDQIVVLDENTWDEIKQLNFAD